MDDFELALEGDVLSSCKTERPLLKNSQKVSSSCTNPCNETLHPRTQNYYLVIIDTMGIDVQNIRVRDERQRGVVHRPQVTSIH